MIPDRVSLDLLEPLSMSQIKKIEQHNNNAKIEMKSLIDLMESPIDKQTELILSPKELDICAMSGSKIHSPDERLVFPCGHVFSLTEVVAHLMDHVFKHPEVLVKQIVYM